MSTKGDRLIEVRVFLTTIGLLGVLIVISGFAAHLIPQGELIEKMVNGKSVRVFSYLDQNPFPIWKIVLSPLMCLSGTNGPKIIVLILFILIIGGSFSIMNGSGFLPAVLTSMVKKFSDKKKMFLILNVCLFSLLGSTLGILEEMAPLILIFVPIAYRMGWDSITGMAIPFLSAGFGFAAATFNPFTIGTAQRLADVALFSGLEIRLPFFIISTTLVIVYLLIYTSKIEKNPEISPTYAMDEKIKTALSQDDSITEKELKKSSVFWMVFCFFLITAVVLSGSFVKAVQDLAFPLIALIFLIMGFGVGILSGHKTKDVFAFFGKGLLDFSPAIVLILMAASVGYIILEGKILDTVLFTVSQHAAGLGKEAAILIIYAFQLLMNALVPSGTGQAVLTIPILAPLGDLLGITRQSVVLAFQFGDGFSNLIWPTNALLLIALGLARVSYRDWFKWVLPIQILLFVICALTLILAVNINYV